MRQDSFAFLSSKVLSLNGNIILINPITMTPQLMPMLFDIPKIWSRFKGIVSFKHFPKANAKTPVPVPKISLPIKIIGRLSAEILMTFPMIFVT